MHDLPVELKLNVLVAERGELLSQVSVFKNVFKK